MSNLRLHAHGGDVSTLHRTLERLVPIDARERALRSFGPATENAIRELQARAGLAVTGVVDTATRDAITGLVAAQDGPFVVRGAVLDPDGVPIVGATVLAVDMDLRRNEVLGKASTDVDGWYEIWYSAKHFTRAEKRSADVVVRALMQDERVAESATIYNAAAELRIDVRADRYFGPSEYERLAVELEPLLDGASAAELSARDIEFLVGETGREAAAWTSFVAAQRLASEGHELPAEAFYAWVRSGLPDAWDALVERASGELRAVVVAAVASHVVPTWLGDQIDKLLVRVPNHQRDELAQVLQIVASGEIVNHVVTRAVGDLDDGMLQRFVDDKALEPADAARIGLAVSVQRLVGGGADRVANVLEGGLGDAKAAVELAALDAKQWDAVLERIGEGGQGKAVARRVAEAFPEQTFRARARREHDGLEAVFANNPGIDLLSVELGPNSIEAAQIDFGDLKPEARATAIAYVQSAQRTQAVTGNAQAAYELRMVGLDSASAVMKLSTEELAKRAEVTLAEATEYRARAERILHDAAIAWFGVHEMARDNAMSPVRTIPKREQFFRQLASYAQLTEQQPWCACEQCHSVLGPAAYFVDLMFFVERYISKPSFGAAETHPLHLPNRRPDLWDGVQLTCAHTNDLVPYLDLVNEALERYLSAVAPFGDVDAIYRALASGDGSFLQPFDWPLVRLTTLLSHFKVTRHRVATALNAAPAVRARARLGLSNKAAELITTERDRAYLIALYRISTTVTTLDAPLAPIEMDVLLTATRLDHSTLASVLRSELVRGGVDPAVTISLGKRDPADVQNNIELVSNLTLRRLDRVHRIARLSRTVPWTIGELDTVVSAGLDPAALERVAALVEIEAWGLSVEELLGLDGAYSPALFDRIFNSPAFARDGVWPPAARFTHPAWSVTGHASPDDSSVARLRAALQLDDIELVRLLGGLATLLDARQTPRSIALTRDGLSALDRHARIARVIGCSITELLDLIAITGLTAIRSLADARAVVELAAWQRTSGWTVVQLRYLVDPAGRDPRDVGTIAGTIVNATRESGLEFAETVFVEAGASEAESRAIVAANLSQAAADALPIERSAAGYRLRGIGLAGLVVPAGTSFGMIESVLRAFDPITVFDTRIAAALSVSLAQAIALRMAAAPRLAIAPIVRVLHRGQDPADITAFIELVRVILRSETLLGRLDSRGIEVFGGVPITLALLKDVVAYASLATARDAGYTTETVAGEAWRLRAVLADLATATDDEVAAALGVHVASITSLRAHMTLPANPFEALLALQRAVVLAAELGVSGETLARIADDAPATAFTSWTRAGDEMLAAFRARYPDPKQLSEKLEPYEDILRARKRDGLVAYLVARWPVPFANQDKLSQYFLLDVAMQGCARTSRIVAATGSLRVYVQRVLLNLERSEDGVSARLDAGRRVEWAWRKHYRVWEANRRVFLYPENYLEPELRDDKTPLFEELEDELLAREIDSTNVGDAYSRYLTGFDEAARLRIAGAHFVPGADAAQPRKLHLFGVTDDDAPVYYYREVIETGPAASPSASFSAWRKISLQIQSRAVTPIVFAGRLYVFWVEVATRPVSTIDMGKSTFTGYRHLVRIKFSYLRTDGAWTAPHLVRFVEDGGSADARLVDDPRDLVALQQLEAQIRSAEATVTAIDQAYVVAVGACDRAAQEAQDATTARVALQVAFLPLPPAPTLELQIVAKVALNPLLLLASVAWGIARGIENEKLTVLANADAAVATVGSAKASADAELARLRAMGAVTPVRWDRNGRDHKEPIESYRPEGWQWERVYADVVGDDLQITFVPKGNRGPSEPGIPGILDLSTGELRPVLPVPSRASGATRATLWSGGMLYLGNVTDTIATTQAHYAATKRLFAAGGNLVRVAMAPASSDVQIAGSAPATNHLVIQTRGDSAWLRPVGSGYGGVRLTTSLTRKLGAVFAREGVDGLLRASNQLALSETASAISPLQSDAARRDPFDARNPYATYYDETFFHIPFIVADHLNSQTKFSDAQRWYHHIFDPTAEDGQAWRSRDLRETSVAPSLREQLTSPEALDAYRGNPFNPHAIARTRPNAYHKAIVMKYIDNLLDWGDALFEQFTIESIDEATLLYTMAQDILGPRPRVLGSCGEGGPAKTYRDVREGFGLGDILVELEVLASPPPKHTKKMWVVEPQQLRMAARALVAGGPPQPGPPVFDGPVATPVTIHDRKQPIKIWTTTTGTPMTGIAPIDFDEQHYLTPVGDLGIRYGLDELDIRHTLDDRELPGKYERRPPVVHLDPIEIIPRTPVFCIPPNRDLLAYWDRVESRLFNIRNCRDIAGVRRRPELFAPEIDPRLLVRLAAAGLSIDEVLAGTTGSLPPYRFTYLVEKAKQHASTVQAFGGQLLAALEKQDGEELARLRSVHEQNLLVMRRKQADLEIRAAEDSLEALVRQRDAASYRREHYAALRAAGQIPSERKQQDLQGAAAGFRTASGVAQVVASVLSIIPDMGAWTAMKFGGSQLGAAGRSVAESLGAMAAFSEMGAQRSGVEASNQRREQEWQHQVRTAQLEIAQLDRSISAAELRRDIARNSLEVHERAITQSEEVFELVRDKFSNVDRYRLLVKDLRRLYRLAFNSALAMVRMAEQAYRTERPDDELALAVSYWDTATSGLLAGEKIAIDLHQLERQYIERNYRELEIEHAFSLAQFAPDALAQLRLTGSCRFAIPEWFFDLTYPGQYRRRLRAVRVTIPCIVGPNGNVGATLRLDHSEIRNTPEGVPVRVPARHTTSIATSRAQSDAGVFDFSFRDERYMPFEGAGAISTWELSLPRTLRTFDYATITDVILHLDYTAQYDGTLADHWDGTARALLELLADNAAPKLLQVIGLRATFPDVFHRLVTSAPGTEVRIALEARHFPSLGRGIVGKTAEVAIVTSAAALPTTSFSIGRPAPVPANQVFATVSAGTAVTDGGALRSFALGSVFDPNGIRSDVLGDYVVKLQTGVDRQTVQDITLAITYSLAR